jgi:hypothetical protein
MIRSYEANSHSAGHEIPFRLYNPKYITVLTTTHKVWGPV